MKQRKLGILFILVLIISLLFSSCSKEVIDLNSIPEYAGVPYVEINGNLPFFESGDMTSVAFEEYSPLDPIGRCGVAFACIGKKIMPTEERGDISSIIPSGWENNGVSNNNRYDFVDNEYIYNRCHLIGFQLAGENDNERNLITGTRYMNIEGMLPFENMVDEYIESTGNHVLYRVTPIYKGLDLVARGVLMEAKSVEDFGLGLSFCVYVYNVQPGVTINYFNGENETNGTSKPNPSPTPDTEEEAQLYILNTSSKKFHYPNKSCSNNIGEKNREEYTGKREDLIKQGYDACGSCKP